MSHNIPNSEIVYSKFNGLRFCLRHFDGGAVFLLVTVSWLKGRPRREGGMPTPELGGSPGQECGLHGSAASVGHAELQ